MKNRTTPKKYAKQSRSTFFAYVSLYVSRLELKVNGTIYFRKMLDNLCVDKLNIAYTSADIYCSHVPL
jgi:hypothetical protein